jgi:hypothetical protein
MPSNIDSRISADDRTYSHWTISTTPRRTAAEGLASPNSCTMLPKSAVYRQQVNVTT